MSETAVERRLAILRDSIDRRAYGLYCCDSTNTTAEADGLMRQCHDIDAGREAIALLQRLIPGVAIGEVCLSEYCQCGTLRTVHEAQALLARCEGETR